MKDVRIDVFKAEFNEEIRGVKAFVEGGIEVSLNTYENSIAIFDDSDDIGSVIDVINGASYDDFINKVEEYRNQ
ncbi:hypothetical protein KNU84_gp083 [Bacteriophage DSS3_VP1]|uniref:Uncharacterized protein n=1 Tax=Bacteriophage DSS3_VP1 TaxID=2664196 RepID=A0A7S5FQB2_9CAUD|nr:hypothetical protein KNU84_gp083 [Bacteriophage DSS3_VP1]QGH74621.1 hypothetical protein DSS3VP1_00053 [Bacteriophage DSS3_VP1]